MQLLEEYRARQIERYREFVGSEKVLRRAVEVESLPAELERVLGKTPSVTGDSVTPSRRLEVFLLTLRHGVLATKARLDWCDEALAVLREAGERGNAPRVRSRGAGSRRRR